MNQLDDLGIPKRNWKFHLDLDAAMFKKLNGLFSFIIRVDNRKIRDFVKMETKTYEHGDWDYYPT